jgi:hypothetical protein
MSPSSVISIVSSLIAVALFVFAIAYWKGKVDLFIKSCVDIPNRTSSLEFKMDVLWPLFVENVLEGKPSLVQRGSGFILTSKSEVCLKEIQSVIDSVLASRISLSPSDVLTAIVKTVGVEKMRELAAKNDCTLSEFLSILTVKLGFV